MSQADVQTAFTSVVGAAQAGYLTTVANQGHFDLDTLVDLELSFAAYADWMTREYFWGHPLLFYVYLDIASARGGEWPHFATYPHNIPRMRLEALRPFQEYLSTRAGSLLTQQDILDALPAATGRNHAGFFEFSGFAGSTPRSCVHRGLQHLGTWKRKP